MEISSFHPPPSLGLSANIGRAAAGLSVVGVAVLNRFITHIQQLRLCLSLDNCAFDRKICKYVIKTAVNAAGLNQHSRSITTAQHSRAQQPQRSWMGTLVEWGNNTAKFYKANVLYGMCV